MNGGTSNCSPCTMYQTTAGSRMFLRALKQSYAYKPSFSRATGAKQTREKLLSWDVRQSHANSDFSEDITSSYPLTKDEVLSYLEKGLEIQNPDKLVKEDKLIFLNTLMEQAKYKLPFTSIPFFSSTGIKHLTLEEQKKAIMTGQGGNCVALNMFLAAVLGHLGLHSYGIGASLYRWKELHLNNHLALVVEDVSNPGSKHLVDVGSRYFLGPVQLDFPRVSPTYTVRQISYKFFNVSLGVVHFCRKVEQPMVTPGNLRLIYYEDQDCWEVMTIFRTQKSMSHSGVMRSLKNNFDNQPKVLETAVRTFLLVGYPKRLMVNITQHQCTTMTEDGHQEVTKFTSKDQLVETVLKYFPHFNAKKIHYATKYYFKE